MNEAMKQAWLEISRMLGEPTREELDVFLRTWQRASQATREALAEQPAQQALDKMAENARELGLDYEPVWNNLPSNKDVEDAMRLKRLTRLAEQPAQRTWVGLTDEERFAIADEYQSSAAAALMVEAKLKEKNT